MQPLFSLEGLKTLDRFTESRVLYAFDYDGTLSPIVRDSTQAKMTEETLKLITRLASQQPVAIISGRKLADLRPRLGFRPHYLVGNHGIEGTGVPPTELRQAILLSRCWTRDLRGQLAAEEKDGVEVENKKFSISIHYRRARNRRRASARIRSALRRLNPEPRLVPGKYVVNVVPHRLPDKGDAILALMKKARLQRALYVGDDTTDENVFSLKGHRIFTVKVGKDRSSEARYFISRQYQINRLLERLLRE